MTIQELCNKIEHLKSKIICAADGDFSREFTLTDIGWRDMDYIRDSMNEISNELDKEFYPEEGK